MKRMICTALAALFFASAPMAAFAQTGEAGGTAAEQPAKGKKVKKSKAHKKSKKHKKGEAAPAGEAK